MKKQIYALFVAAGFFTSCEEEFAEVTTYHAADYYPTEVGKYIIYNVDSIVYNETIENDTTHWQIKEEIIDTFYDLDSILNHRIERSRRPDDTSAWQVLDEWSVRNKNGNIERDENNLRFIKLAEPVLLNKSWDGTAYLGNLFDLPFYRECDRLDFLEDWDYTYIVLDSSVVINSLQFDSVIAVKQQGADNLIELNNAIELYVKGVGLIKKQFYHYTSQNTDNIPWEFKAECGYVYTMEIVEYN
ncbi:MAG: hypothetical protein ACKVPJ_04400 [Chitinophagales bacterium]